MRNPNQSVTMNEIILNLEFKLSKLRVEYVIESHYGKFMDLYHTVIFGSLAMRKNRKAQRHVLREIKLERIKLKFEKP